MKQTLPGYPWAAQNATFLAVIGMTTEGIVVPLDGSSVVAIALLLPISGLSLSLLLRNAGPERRPNSPAVCCCAGSRSFRLIHSEPLAVAAHNLFKVKDHALVRIITLRRVLSICYTVHMILTFHEGACVRAQAGDTTLVFGPVSKGSKNFKPTNFGADVA